MTHNSCYIIIIFITGIYYYITIISKLTIKQMDRQDSIHVYCW